MFSLTPYELNVTAWNALGAAWGTLPFLLENVSESLQDPPVPSFGLSPVWGVGFVGARIVPAQLPGGHEGPVPNNPMLDPDIQKQREVTLSTQCRDKGVGFHLKEDLDGILGRILGCEGV